MNNMICMTALSATIKKELLLLVRDVHGLALLFVMPVSFILIMSLALQNQFASAGAKNSNSKKIAVLVEDKMHNDESSRVTELLQQRDAFSWQAADANTAADIIRRDQAAFLLTLQQQDDGLHADILVAPGTTAQTEAIFTATVSEALSRQRIEALLRTIKMKNALRNNDADSSYAMNSDNSIDDSALRSDALQVHYSYRTEQDTLKPSSVQQSVPAWLVFAMFFSVVPLANTLISERQQGTLRRLRTMPVSPALPIIGKLVPYFFINQIQVILMLAVGVYLMPLFGADSLTLGHSIAGLALMSVALSMAALGYGILIAAAARTTEQATTLGGVGNILLAALGGIMVPRFVMPETMQHIAAFSPMAWGLEGFLDIFLRNGNVRDVLPEAGSLLLFGCVTITLAMRLQKTATT